MNPSPNFHPTNQTPFAGTPNFNPLARLYRWMEFFTFGPFLVQTRNAFLPEISTASSALVLGDGDGRFTARLLRANSHIQVDAIDASPAMLHALLGRAGSNATRVRIHCADARQFYPANPPYDLIVTHFFLDCLTTSEISSLGTRVRAAASANALWIVSEFAIPSVWYGRVVARPLIWTLYRAFGFLTGLAVRALPDHRAALRQSGFTLQRQRTRLAGLLVSELWSVNPGLPGESCQHDRCRPATNPHPLVRPTLRGGLSDLGSRRNCYSRVKISFLGAARPLHESPPGRPP